MAARFLVLILMVSLIAACGGSSDSSSGNAGGAAPTPISTPMPTPTSTPVPAPTPTTVPTAVPTVVPEVPPTSVATLAPSPTSTPSSSNPTPTPNPAPSATPTPVLVVPSGGVSIINSSLSSAAFWAGNGVSGDVGSKSIVDVAHPAFSQASRIAVNSPTGEFWNGQLSFPTIANISANDIVLIHFYFRSVANTYESGASFVTAFIEDADFNKYTSREVSAATQWQEYFIPVVITDSEAQTQIALKFGFGAGDRAQTFDIAGVELLNFGNSVNLADLPITLPTYVGRAADAAWRAAANARIEQYRKGDFVLNVVDGAGSPIANASVDVSFEQHAYHFGSVTVGHILASNSADAQMYKAKVLELFNQSGPENDLKWAPWDGEWGTSFAQAQTLSGLKWLRDNGLYTRGHVMVWPSKRNLPNSMQAYLPDDPASANPQAKQAVLDHIDDIAQATSAYLDEWDVLNEPYDNHYLMDAFGESVMVDWFNRARTNLPNHKLYINDYSILSAQGRNLAHQQHYQNTIQYLLDSNAPVNGIGLQSHFSETPTAIETVYNIVDRFATAFPSLSLRATEFDISTTYEELQADYTRDFLTIFFSHPATVGVQCWGFWAGAHWRESAAMYDIDWREKPNAKVWKELIYSQWWNNFTGVTNTQGAYANRGFYGTYAVKITVAGETKHFNFSLAPAQSNVFNLSF